MNLTDPHMAFHCHTLIICLPTPPPPLPYQVHSQGRGLGRQTLPLAIKGIMLQANGDATIKTSYMNINIKHVPKPSLALPVLG